MGKSLSAYHVNFMLNGMPEGRTLCQAHIAQWMRSMLHQTQSTEELQVRIERGPDTCQICKYRNTITQASIIF